ncbi:MAG: hypothetical protein ABR508_00570 [Candidatus Baltobacteraceae bacterium]
MPDVANVAFEYKIVSGEPDERLCAQLGALSSSGGWEVVAAAHAPHGLICLLKREKDFEVAQSLHVALEETQTIAQAVARREMPPEEIL